MKLSRTIALEYKENFILYLDLHGHSVKKNVFAYGPDYPMTDVIYFRFF